MASPEKLAHIVLWTRQVPKMRDWYLKVLDARVVYQNPAAAFLTYDEEHHRVALADPDAAADMAADQEVRSDGLIGTEGATRTTITPEEVASLPLHGLSHVAFTFAELGDLLENYARLQGEAIEPTAAINHGTTTSMYYADPDGNQVELQIDNFATIEEGVAFMESDSFARNPVGVPFDPGTWVKRLEAGESSADMVRPTW
ncbi:MAG TPA: VOC family protein [Trebonia sp.]|jgi:catechol-2,3-dioxygenase